MAIRFVTDSTSYFPRDERERHGLTVVGLNVTLDGRHFDDDASDYQPFFDALAASRSFPTSSQPSAHELVEAFTRIVQAGDSAVGVFISAEMSGTFSTASLARDIVRQSYPDAVIELVDSRSNSMELGFAVWAGIDAAEAGADMTGVLDAIHRRMDRTRFIFAPDTLEYLRRGGRIGGGAALLGSLLQVRPILTVVDGVTEVFAKVRTTKRAMETMVAAVKSDAEKKGGLVGACVHNISDPAKGQTLVDMLSAATGFVARSLPIGPVIGTHVGPGAVGIVYHTREEMHK